MELKNGIQVVCAKTRPEWRQWLAENHQSEKSAWLIIYHKESSTPSIYYDEAVEEALCFGWVDSKPNKRDAESYYLFMAQRKAGSKWSRLNRQRAEKMIGEGLMAPAGMALITLAKQSGTWTALEDVQNSVVPPDLENALLKNELAAKNFHAFPPSSKRIILEWILNAKKAETRQKRIEETVRLAAENIKANHYRQ